MQIVLDKVSDRAKKMGLMLKEEKTKVFHGTRKIAEGSPALRLEGKDLEVVRKVKVLGMMFDKTASWRAQLDYVRARVQKIYNLMRVMAAPSYSGSLIDGA